MEEALAALQTDIATCQVLDNRLRGKDVSQQPKARPAKAKANARSQKNREKPLARAKDDDGDDDVITDTTNPVKESSAKNGCTAADAGSNTRSVGDMLRTCIHACQESRKRHREESGPPEDTSDESLSQYTRFTDEMALDDYKQFLHYVPRLVNVVTLAEAIPMEGSGLSLPLNLANIAARCKGSYYAPRRFAAVQLAFHSPRARVLVFHTGRLVGTGTSGSDSARLAIALAQHQLATEANVHLHVRNFAVINSVGAVSLRATLNCDAFALAHSSESHFDRSSFVGLAWRPPRESICCEIYSTGRANLPGSVNERQLLGSFSHMLPELLRFSSASHLLAKIPEEMQAHHKIDTAMRAANAEASAPCRKLGRAGRLLQSHVEKQVVHVKEKANIWDGWASAAQAETSLFDASDEEGEDLDLNALGL